MEHVVNKIPISFTEVSSSVMVFNSIRVNTSKCVMCREVILGRKYQKFEIVAKGCISMSLKAHFVLEDVKALHSLSFYCNINCGV